MIDTSRRVLVFQHQDDCPLALVSQWLIEAGRRLDGEAEDHLFAEAAGLAEVAA